MIQLDALAKSAAIGFNFGEIHSIYPQLNLTDVANDYRKIAGDVEDNYVIGGTINFLYRKMQEVTLVLQEEVKAGKWINYEGSYIREPLLKFEEANEYFASKAIYYGIIRDLMDFGNSYVLIQENRQNGSIKNFVYLERDRVRPFTVMENGVSVLYYEYSPRMSQPVVYPARLMLHFRWGVDRNNPLVGVPIIRGALKEVANDTALAIASTNKADKGNNSDVIFTADSDARSPRAELKIESIKKLFQLWRAGSREGSGLPMVLPMNVKMHTKGYSPVELQISQQRNDLAPRIGSSAGIDVMVLGLPSENKTYSNYKEAIGNAVENAFVPLINVIADTINAKIRYYTGKNESSFRIGFDITQIKGLQEGVTARHERLRLDFRSNMVTLGVVQEELGYPVDEVNAEKYFSELVSLGNPEAPAEDTSGKAKNERSG